MYILAIIYVIISTTLVWSVSAKQIKTRADKIKFR